MDVSKLVLPFIFLSLAACEKSKTVSDVANYKNGNQTSAACPSESLVKTRFVVKYEDGRVEVVEAENEEMFERHFVEPNLQQIKRIEYDALVTVVNPDTQESNIQTSAEAGDWGNAMIRADSAWNQGVFGQGVTVAVIDTAVDTSHPQLAPRFVRDGSGNPVGWDFIKNLPSGPVTVPGLDHGSHVAGIIAADPSTGSMSGVAPAANLIQASFIDDENGSIGAGIAAIRYATSKGARIINASWGGNACSETLKETIEEAGTQGVLFVAASGNEGIDYDYYPYFSFPAVFNLATQITVAATDTLDRLTGFSNRSFSLVHVAAPGDQIRSTVPSISHPTGYKILSGTSMATPFVSGTAALLWSAKPNATVAQIKAAILTSTDFRSYKVSTQGRLNVEKALAEIRRIVP